MRSMLTFDTTLTPTQAERREWEIQARAGDPVALGNLVETAAGFRLRPAERWRVQALDFLVRLAVEEPSVETLVRARFMEVRLPSDRLALAELVVKRSPLHRQFVYAHAPLSIDDIDAMLNDATQSRRYHRNLVGIVYAARNGEAWGELALVELAQKKRPGAFDELYRAKDASVVRPLLKRKLPDQKVDEASQNVWERASKGIETVRYPLAFDAWLQRITEKEISDSTRADDRHGQRTHATEPNAPAIDAALLREAATRTDPIDLIEYRDTLQRALAESGCSEADKVLLWNRDVLEVPRELLTHPGQTPNALSVRLSRMRKHVRKVIVAVVTLIALAGGLTAIRSAEPAADRMAVGVVITLDASGSLQPGFTITGFAASLSAAGVGFRCNNCPLSMLSSVASWSLSALSAVNDGTDFSYNDTTRLLDGFTDTNGRVTVEFDPSGRLERVASPRGVASYTYGATGELSSSLDVDGGQSTYMYDSNSNLTSLADPHGKTTRFVYDEQRRLQALRLPNGASASFGYDALDCLSWIRLPGGLTTRLSHDAAGRLTTVTDPKGRLTSITYDADGRMRSLTRPDGQETLYSYDALGRVVRAQASISQTVLPTVTRGH
jgi:YD repeat-containing protein